MPNNQDAVKLPTKQQYIKRVFSMFNHYACAKCGWPVMNGYCCTNCGDSIPDEAEIGMDRITFSDLPEAPTPREQELEAQLKRLSYQRINPPVFAISDAARFEMAVLQYLKITKRVTKKGVREAIAKAKESIKS